MSAEAEEAALLARAGAVAEVLREREVEALLVSEPVNLRYLTGFTGSSGLALIPAEGEPGFFTDFRYETQSEAQLPGIFAREIVTGDLLEAVAHGVAEGGRLGFEEASLSVKRHARLAELLGEGSELVPCGGVIEGLREVKDAGEVARIRAAAELAEEALRGVLEEGLAGRTEREVAIELELRMRRLGAERPSFPSIVAAGEHSALPHAEPREVEIPSGVLLTIDWGAMLEGYCSDCTRTYATGELPEEAREVYELVRQAQARALAALRPGLSGREVDAVAREVIERGGHGERFGHGLGHGVGMDIHEGPRLSRTGGEGILRAGNVVTVEPGVYLPGRFGVRIEDLVLVTEEGAEILSALPKELTVVS